MNVNNKKTPMNKKILGKYRLSEEINLILKNIVTELLNHPLQLLDSLSSHTSYPEDCCNLRPIEDSLNT